MTAPWAQAFFTFIVGASVAYIAWKQWQTAREKLALELFEKRLATYRVLTTHFYPPFPEENIRVTVAEVRNAAMESYFLFGEEVSKNIVKYHDKKLSNEQMIEVNTAMDEMHKYMRFDAMPTKARMQLFLKRFGPRV